MRAKLYKALNATQARYEKYFDNFSQHLLTLKSGVYVYVNESPTLKPNKETNDETSSKLQPNMIVQLRNAAIASHTAAIDDYSILRAESMDLASLALNPNCARRNDSRATEAVQRNEKTQ